VRLTVSIIAMMDTVSDLGLLASVMSAAHRDVAHFKARMP
jgi:hypothetical protein